MRSRRAGVSVPFSDFSEPAPDLAAGVVVLGVLFLPPPEPAFFKVSISSFCDLRSALTSPICESTFCNILSMLPSGLPPFGVAPFDRTMPARQGDG